METVGKALAEKDKEHVLANMYVACSPMQSLKVFEDAAYSLPIGVVSEPVRTEIRFHLIKVHSRKPNPGAGTCRSYLDRLPERFRYSGLIGTGKAQAIYKASTRGADFGELAERIFWGCCFR